MNEVSYVAVALAWDASSPRAFNAADLTFICPLSLWGEAKAIATFVERQRNGSVGRLVTCGYGIAEVAAAHYSMRGADWHMAIF